jgi:hypothetical protein
MPELVLISAFKCEMKDVSCLFFCKQLFFCVGVGVASAFLCFMFLLGKLIFLNGPLPFDLANRLFVILLGDVY